MSEKSIAIEKLNLFSIFHKTELATPLFHLQATHDVLAHMIHKFVAACAGRSKILEAVTSVSQSVKLTLDAHATHLLPSLD